MRRQEPFVTEASFKRLYASRGLSFVATARPLTKYLLHAGAVHDSSAYDTAPTGNVTGLDTGYGNNNVANSASRGYVGNTPTGGTPVLHTDRV